MWFPQRSILRRVNKHFLPKLLLYLLLCGKYYLTNTSGLLYMAGPGPSLWRNPSDLPRNNLLFMNLNSQGQLRDRREVEGSHPSMLFMTAFRFLFCGLTLLSHFPCLPLRAYCLLDVLRFFRSPSSWTANLLDLICVAFCSS